MFRDDVRRGIDYIRTALALRGSPRGTVPCGLKEKYENGNWHREVVQRFKGLRIRHAGRRGRRRFLPPVGHPGDRLSVAHRGTEGGIRRDEGPQGPSGVERSRDLLRI